VTEGLWKTGKLVQDTCKNWTQMLPRCAYAHCPGRNSIVNGFLRRGEGFHCNGRAWYCSPDCLESALTDSFRQIVSGQSSDLCSPRARLPIGQLFVLKGIVSEPDLRLGLQHQVERGGLLGECMEELGLLTEEAVTASLASQWACPMFPERSIQSGCSTLVPLVIERAYEFLPVHLASATKTIYVAHARAINYSVLYAIEQMLGHHAEPCVLPRRLVRLLVESRGQQQTSSEICFDAGLSAPEMARTVRSYAQQLRSESLKFTLCGKFLWVAINGPRQDVPLLFECSKRGSELDLKGNRHCRR
jgi:hypothetical protein